MALSLHDAVSSWDELSSPATTFTVTSGATALIVAVRTETIGSTTNVISGVSSSVDGDLTLAEAEVSASGGNENRAAIYYLANPSTGAHGITVTYAVGTPNDVYLSALSLTGDFYGVAASGSDIDGSTLSIGGLAYTADDFGVAAAVHGGTGTAWAPSSGWTERLDTLDASSLHHLQTRNYTGSGTDTVTAGLTGTPTREAGVAVIFAGSTVPLVRATHSVQADYNGDLDFADANEDLSGDGLVLQPPEGRAITVKRGNNITNPVVPPSIASASFDLDNRNGGFDIGTIPIDPNDAVRVRSTWDSTTYGLFQGYVSKIRHQPHLEEQRVAVEALGPGGQFVRKKGYSVALVESRRIDLAIGDVLDAVGWPAGLRSLDTATRTCEFFWLDVEDDPWRVLNQLVNAEGPLAQLYSDGDGNIVFEAQDYRGVNARTTSAQHTFRGHTTEPVYSRILRYDDGIDGVINKAAIPWKALGTQAGEIEFVGASTAEHSSSAASPLTITAISGLRAGDVILVGAKFATNITTPAISGFTELHNDATGSGNDSWTGWRRVTAADIGVDLSLTWGGGNAIVGAVAAAYRGVLDIGTPYDAETSVVRDNDASPVATGAASVGADRRFVTMLLTGDDQYTVPANYTEVATLTNSGHAGNVHVADREVAAAGTETPEWTGLTDATQDSVVFLIALTPNTSAVWSYGGDLVLSAGETKAIRIDPSAIAIIDAITPVSGDDYTVSAGALSSAPALTTTAGPTLELTMTAGTGGATVQGPTDDPTIGIRVRADQLVVLASGQAEAEDSTSQTAYDIRGLRSYASWPYIAEGDAEDLVGDVIAAFKDPRPVAVFEIHADRADATLTDCLSLEISDAVRLIEARHNIDLNLAWVESLEYQIGQGGTLKVIVGVKEDV